MYMYMYMYITYMYMYNIDINAFIPYDVKNYGAYSNCLEPTHLSAIQTVFPFNFEIYYINFAKGFLVYRSVMYSTDQMQGTCV